MSDTGIRGGETLLGFDPAAQDDASLAFIGVLRSDWQPGSCPRNIRQAREAGGGGARIELAPGYASALAGLQVGQVIWLLTWMDRSRRDLALQSPAHADGPRGTFSLRSPARPNPVAMSAVRITALVAEAGVIGIDASDAYDGTPVIDLKPWIATVDVPPEEQPG
ncbi:tRNA (N6-threonylcarbamoyladenosine(37)-N6)-methyltransferase TrmO [Pseudooceanicola lipolyticus]|uniref:tRNA (N6-threonylcarbamoyladenosine(37)-N6)-methyltransferase TrmO n=1 Tax=Pseudooceanicola lipolyticus TaxID=2029104 RepID=A0A2M8J1H2_9RHOB|nr:SAM-dependent methyltransferase [Pseudooceanicola lipolyticus]PJE36612.1 tRNA (N6-threonylcarbamoyladenosine(37)-N6)-methyltransferase TrmO [Pseudooceanicola lipolyticus]